MGINPMAKAAKRAELARLCQGVKVTVCKPKRRLRRR